MIKDEDRKTRTMIVETVEFINLFKGCKSVLDMMRCLSHLEEKLDARVHDLEDPYEGFILQVVEDDYGFPSHIVIKGQRPETDKEVSARVKRTAAAVLRKLKKEADTRGKELKLLKELAKRHNKKLVKLED